MPMHTHTHTQACAYLERRLRALPRLQFALLSWVSVKAVQVDATSPGSVDSAVRAVTAVLRRYTPSGRHIAARAWVMASGLVRACEPFHDRAAGERIIRDVMRCPVPLASELWDGLRDIAIQGGLVPRPASPTPEDERCMDRCRLMPELLVPVSDTYFDALSHATDTISDFVEEGLHGGDIPSDVAREDAEAAAVGGAVVHCALAVCCIVHCALCTCLCQCPPCARGAGPLKPVQTLFFSAPSLPSPVRHPRVAAGRVTACARRRPRRVLPPRAERVPHPV